MMKELEYPFDSGYILQHKKSIKRELNKQEGLLEKKIALLSGSTIGETKNILEIFLLNQGIKPVFWEGEYDRFYEDIMFENKELEEFAPDLIYIHTTSKNIKKFPIPGDNRVESEKIMEAEWIRFSSVWNKIEEIYQCPVIVNNFEPLPFRVLGNRECYDESGALRMIQLLNMKMSDYALEHPFLHINDLSYESAVIGLDEWYDHSKWYLYKYAFSLEAIPFVAFQISNIIKAIYGKNQKAVALDLDNTLWGGIIGDDGVENIKLGIETSEGMAFSDFQHYLKMLQATGVSLNICSKNDPELGISGFSHPSAELSAEDFIVKEINWENKDANIHKIAKSLNLMEDAIVFVDDNPMERGIVSENTDAHVLPVTAPESYTQILDRSGFFESTGILSEDKKRNDYYRANVKREKAAEVYTDYSDYLKALEMKCELSLFHVDNIQRVTQLINKTNQFNLTTKRYTVDEVTAFTNQAENIAFCGRLTDKFGDNGIVSVIMAEEKDKTADISLWIMSCRVFKRDLEYAMFDHLIEQCQNRNITKIRGNYYRTKKNGLVADFYEKLGFICVERDEDHGIYEYDIPVIYEKKNKVMECHDESR